MLVITLIAALVLGIVIAALPHVVYLLAWMVGKGFHDTVPYAPFGWTALALVAVVWAVLAWGCFVGRWRLQTTRMEYAHSDIPLTLSGHTHSAQVRLFGWTPASWMFKEAWGRYDEGERTLNVNAGLDRYYKTQCNE